MVGEAVVGETATVVHDLGPLHRDGVLGGGGQAGTRPLLTLQAYANCDRSTTPPVLNVNDFVCFQTRFAAGDSIANCDGSTLVPILNINDFVCFQAAFASGDPYANCDASTGPPILTVNDFVCYQSAFAAGCP